MAELIDATANMTLDEIRARCIDNFWLLSKVFKNHLFDTVEKAMAFVVNCQAKALQKLGAHKEMLRMRQQVGRDISLLQDPVRRQFYEKRIENELRRRGVKVEHLVYGKEFRSLIQQADTFDQLGYESQANEMRKLALRQPDQRPEDWLRSGFYVWKGQYKQPEDGETNVQFIYDEIAYFMCDPILIDASKLASETIVVPGRKKYMVRTNVPM